MSPFFIALLFWYPAFENLFSILRRKFYQGKNVKYADNLHLHHLLFNVLKQKIDNLSADEIPDFAESKAKREYYLAELAKLDVEEKKKQLVSVDDIKKSSFAKGRAIREALTNLADRLSHQLAGEDDATVIHQIINSEHKEALNNLAQL